MNRKKVELRSGVCPACGAENSLRYTHTPRRSGDTQMWIFECDKCLAEGSEEYKLQFLGSTLYHGEEFNFAEEYIDAGTKIERKK